MLGVGDLGFRVEGLAGSWILYGFLGLFEFVGYDGRCLILPDAWTFFWMLQVVKLFFVSVVCIIYTATSSFRIASLSAQKSGNFVGGVVDVLVGIA